MKDENDEGEVKQLTIINSEPYAANQKKYKDEIAKLNDVIAERDARIEELSRKIAS